VLELLRIEQQKSAGRKHKEKIRKMTKAARKAESEGKKTFTYEGKKYDVEPRYSSGMIWQWCRLELITFQLNQVKPKKPVKKSTGGIIKASKTITKKKTASRNKKGMGTKWESRWG
jgi:hypothetical protein